MILRDPQARAVLVEPLPRERATDFGYARPYRFGRDWFSHDIPLWAVLLKPYMGKPGLRYLEIGVYQGRSLLWMIEHVLTQPDSTATGIDIKFLPALLHNVKISGAADRTTLIGGASQLELRKLEPFSYDVIYIDGSHRADDVMEDLTQSWRLLKPGGLMILDDYEFTGDKGAGELPPELRPALAIDAFISAYRSEVKILHRGYQVALSRRRGVCAQGRWRCSSLGRYSYSWDGSKLYDGKQEVAISPAERRVVEALIRGKQGDALTIRLRRDVFESPAFASLNRRLHLGFVAPQ